MPDSETHKTYKQVATTREVLETKVTLESLFLPFSLDCDGCFSADFWGA